MMSMKSKNPFKYLAISLFFGLLCGVPCRGETEISIYRMDEYSAQLDRMRQESQARLEQVRQERIEHANAVQNQLRGIRPAPLEGKGTSVVVLNGRKARQSGLSVDDPESKRGHRLLISLVSLLILGGLAAAVRYWTQEKEA